LKRNIVDPGAHIPILPVSPTSPLNSEDTLKVIGNIYQKTQLYCWSRENRAQKCMFWNRYL